MNKYFSLVHKFIHAVILLLAIVFALNGFWVGILMLLPTLFGDMIVRWSTKSVTAVIVKVVLLLQVFLFCSYIYSSNKNMPPVLSVPLSSQVFPGMKQFVLNENQDIKQLTDNEDVAVKNDYNEVVHEAQTGIKENSKKIDYIPESSYNLIVRTLGNIGSSDFPDLKYRPPEEVRRKMKRIFEELPATGFNPVYKSPCWSHEANLRSAHGEPVSTNRDGSGADAAYELEDGRVMTCLPHVYILGQPKCGTSDLFVRLSKHPDILTPKRKEVPNMERNKGDDDSS